MRTFAVKADVSAPGFEMSVSRDGFGSVQDATRELFELLGSIACHWGEICEDGASATGYVLGDGYQDTYNVEMG